MEHWLERLTALLHRANSDDFLPIFHNPKIDATNDSLQNNQKCEIKGFPFRKNDPIIILTVHNMAIKFQRK